MPEADMHPRHHLLDMPRHDVRVQTRETYLTRSAAGWLVLEVVLTDEVLGITPHLSRLGAGPQLQIFVPTTPCEREVLLLLW